MDSQKQQILERIKQANNILVTVSANPSVDQLSSCLGLTIMLNELGKHATAVFSGAVPSTIEFLQPEKTLEKNTDSLRDFIIALDKAKADKLRYKVEDTVVKIFITPYRTSIDEKDLEFSQGDFNVEAVVALGVHDQKDLDQAITSHGRILHDATVMSINTTAGNNLGTINWQDPKASSLSEMVASLAENFDKKVLDNQVATALLTGIVAETDRFSNSKTFPDTMKASAQLMAAGANQQLVATKLQEPAPIPAVTPTGAESENAGQPPEAAKSNDGTLQIEHDAADMEAAQSRAEEKSEEADNGGPQIHIDDTGALHQLDTDQAADHEQPPKPPVEPPKQPEPPHQLGEDRELLEGPGPTSGGLDAMSGLDESEKPSGEPMVTEGAKFVFDPPTLGGTLTANSKPEDLEPTTDPLSAASSDQQPMLSHDEPASSSSSAGPLVITPPEDDAKKLEIDAAAALAPPAVDTPSNDAVTTALPPITLPEPQVDPVPASPAPVTTPLDIPAPSMTPLAPPSPPTMPADDTDQTTPPMLTPTMPLPAADTAVPVETVTTTTPADGEDEFTPDVSTARDAVMSAIDASGPTDTASPIVALNAQPLGGPLHDEQTEDAPANTFSAPVIQPLGNPNFNEAAPDAASPSAQPLDMPLPPTLLPPPAVTTPPTSSQMDDPTAPPPVPPPMMPPFGSPGGQ